MQPPPGPPLQQGFLGKPGIPSHPFNPPVCSVQPYLEDGATLDDSYRQSLTDIHTSAVTNAMASTALSIDLRQLPLPFNTKERSFPRYTQATLVQLRSGFSSPMEDRFHWLGRQPSPLLPMCSVTDYLVPHLFYCTARPTNLCEWPQEGATFLFSFPSFTHLLALPPTPLEPPPDHPPVPWPGSLPLTTTNTLVREVWRTPTALLAKLLLCLNWLIPRIETDDDHHTMKKSFFWGGVIVKSLAHLPCNTTHSHSIDKHLYFPPKASFLSQTWSIESASVKWSLWPALVPWAMGVCMQLHLCNGEWHLNVQ